MKKILVNVNEENLEKIREEWAGMRGYRSSNSDIMNELMMEELFKLQRIHLPVMSEMMTCGVTGTRKSVRTLDEAYKESKNLHRAGKGSPQANGRV